MQFSLSTPLKHFPFSQEKSTLESSRYTDLQKEHFRVVKNLNPVVPIRIAKLILGISFHGLKDVTGLKVQNYLTYIYQRILSCLTQILLGTLSFLSQHTDAKNKVLFTDNRFAIMTLIVYR